MSNHRAPLNILQVASCFPGWGGTELHLLNLSEQLVKRGHKVTITARPGLFMEESAQARGLRAIPVSVIKQQDWRDRKAIMALLRQERFDVVHAHWRPDYVVTPTLARICRVPAVFISHHSPKPLKGKEVAIYPRLHHRMIALSESVRRMLVGQGLPADFVRTIHHGTDTDAFRQTTQTADETRAEWGIPAGRFVVGMVGRVAMEKGILDFVAALDRLTHLPIHAVIVGDGPQEDEVRAAAKSLLDTGRITFGGFRRDVNNAVNALDALVLASTWEEPCAAVVQQAMALSRPVIGTDRGGTPEMIAANVTGLVIPPGDPAALARAIARLAGDPALCARLGAAGRERVEAHFTLRGMVDTIENLYYEQLTVAGRVPSVAPRETARVGETV